VVKLLEMRAASLEVSETLKVRDHFWLGIILMIMLRWIFEKQTCKTCGQRCMTRTVIAANLFGFIIKREFFGRPTKYVYRSFPERICIVAEMRTEIN